MKTKKSIQLDVQKDFKELIAAKQGDTLSRFLDITLFDGGETVNLTNNSVKVYAKKPDGTIVFNNVTILDTVNGKIEIELTSQMLAIPGTVAMELEVMGLDESILTTVSFLLTVIQSIRNDIV